MFSECRHIKPSGSKCHSPALRDMPYCYFHASLHRLADAKNRPANEPFQIPPLEDVGAIQIALLQVIDGLGSSRLDPRRAGLFLYAIQIAAQVMPRPAADQPNDVVQTVSADDKGELLAPDESVCEPPADCRKCLLKSQCLSTKRMNFRSVKRILTQIKNGQDKWDQQDLDRSAKSIKRLSGS
jgi:hypothetical protein